MKETSHIAKPEHEVTYQDLLALVSRHNVTSYETLAIAANMVGKLVAMQDQRKVTTAMALAVVARNVEIGNEQMIAELSKKTGGRA